MIYIKKIIFFIITSSFTLVVLLTLILFFYAAFFFQPTLVERKKAEDQITKNMKTSLVQSKKTSPEKIPKIDEPKVEDVIVTPKEEVVIKDALFATIGNKAVTQSDILNEIKIILILTGQSFTEDIKEELQSGAIQSVIKRNIKKIEIEKHNFLSFDQLDINRELKKLANSLYMDVDTFENTFIANGIPFSDVIDQVKTEILWNSLIFQLYKNRLIINLDEIDEQLKSVQNKKEIHEYLISEIIINSVPQDKIESTIKELKNKIKIEGFKRVAINSSISETALSGGNLGWVSENAISEKFKSKIINTPVGNVSAPIFLPEGILLFKVTDKRKSKKFTNLEDAKNELVRAEKTKILRMHALSHFESIRKSISINYY